MGRLNHAASRVHSHAAQILQNTRHTYPPPWLSTIQTTPPSEKLVRPALQRGKRAKQRSSQLFKPVSVSYEEDNLRWEYFNDHPWELAKPRVILENDGRDAEKWDWGVELDVSLNRPKHGKQQLGRTQEQWEITSLSQAARPLNGESVVQRQNWLLRHTNLTVPAAYDKARKELYRVRHFRETEQRVAREEALSTGAFFGLGPLEIGMRLEDAAYEDWREWAKAEIQAQKQLEAGAYGGAEVEESALEIQEEDQQELQEVSASVPASKSGQTAKGGAAIHP